MIKLPRSRLRAFFQYAAGFLLFFLIWWGGSVIVGPRVLPPPGRVLAYIVLPGVPADFAREIARTLARGLLGFSVAWVIAIPAGLLMGRRRASERMGFFPVILLQSAPPLFWIMPLVLWLGTDGMVAPAVAFFISLPLLTTHVTAAIKHIPEHEFDVFRIYAHSSGVVARELYIPRLLPAIRSNVQLGFLLSIKGAMLAEWFAAQNGFGRRVQIFYQFFSLTEFLAWAFMFLLVVGGLSLAIKRLLDLALPRYRTTTVPDVIEAGKRSGDKTGRVPPRVRGVGPTVRTDEDLPRHVELRKITYGYEHGAPLFGAVDLRIGPEKPLVLYGPSGCGKTTLLKVIAGLADPWDGTVIRPGRAALVFQEDALLDHRDALGNVLLPALPDYSASDVARAREALAVWGLARSEHQFPHELSGGMRKRLSMARAWFSAPALYLLDEPFVNLDKEARLALWDTLFTRLPQANTPALIVTHYPEEISGYEVDVRPWESLTSK